MTTGFKQTFSPQDVFARQIASGLDASLEDLPHHVSERLRVARLRALTLQTPDGIFSSQNTIAGSQTYKQTQAAIMALDLLRRYLQNSCL